MSINETQSTLEQLNKGAAQNDASLHYVQVHGITGITAPHINHAVQFNQERDWFNKSIESAANFTPVAGPSITAGLAVAMATGSPLLGGLAATGVAVHTTFKGSGPKGRG